MPPVAPTPCPVSDAKQDQGDSDVCLQSVCDPPQAKDNTAEQRAGAAAPSLRKATTTKPVTGATRQPQGPRTSHLRQTMMGMPPVNGRWSPAGRGAALPPLPVLTASPEPDQGYVMSALQTPVEQMPHLTRDVGDLKTRVQHHHNERAVRPGSAQEAPDSATIQDGGPRRPRDGVVLCSFADAEALYDRLLHTIEGFIATPRALARTHTPCCWTYTTDPVILNCQQMLAAYQRPTLHAAGLTLLTL
ncbi:hypothetical protein O3P69_007229 [Scylla paramamosain]|uniref:Uncharacterized protein n=1 Tax=Scylla paramamosain TaxID=85552 RepID=A0AAW0V683_SCYPA